MQSVSCYISFSNVLNIQLKKRTQMAKLGKVAAVLLDSDGNAPALILIDRLLRLWHCNHKNSILAEAALHPIRLAALRKSVLLDKLPAHHHSASLALLLMLTLHPHDTTLHLDFQLVWLVAGGVEVNLPLVLILVVLDRAAVSLPVQHRSKVVVK